MISGQAARAVRANRVTRAPRDDSPVPLDKSPQVRAWLAEIARSDASTVLTARPPKLDRPGSPIGAALDVIESTRYRCSAPTLPTGIQHHPLLDEWWPPGSSTEPSASKGDWGWLQADRVLAKSRAALKESFGQATTEKTLEDALGRVRGHALIPAPVNQTYSSDGVFSARGRGLLDLLRARRGSSDLPRGYLSRIAQETTGLPTDDREAVLAMIIDTSEAHLREVIEQMKVGKAHPNSARHTRAEWIDDYLIFHAGLPAGAFTDPMPFSMNHPLVDLLVESSPPELARTLATIGCVRALHRDPANGQLASALHMVADVVLPDLPADDQVQAIGALQAAYRAAVTTGSVATPNARHYLQMIHQSMEHQLTQFMKDIETGAPGSIRHSVPFFEAWTRQQALPPRADIAVGIEKFNRFKDV